MASAIDATVKGVSANSYVTLAEATTYFSNRLHKDAWTNAGSSDKTAALLWATRLLDTRMQWQGNKTLAAQALAWPRSYVTDVEKSDSWGTEQYLDEDTLPLFLKDAQCEMALALLNGDVTIDSASVGMNAVSIGPLSVQYNSAEKPATLPKSVRDLCSPYATLPPNSGGGTVGLIRM